jgi:hypothetical protein
LCEVAINALRKVINDEDKCNLAIKRELEKGPNLIRVLSREELKMEVKKFKNISIKIAAEFSKAEVDAETVCSNKLSLVLNSDNPFEFNKEFLTDSKSIFKLESSNSLLLNLFFKLLNSVNTSRNISNPNVVWSFIDLSTATSSMDVSNLRFIL